MISNRPLWNVFLIFCTNNTIILNDLDGSRAFGVIFLFVAIRSNHEPCPLRHRLAVAFLSIAFPTVKSKRTFINRVFMDESGQLDKVQFLISIAFNQSQSICIGFWWRCWFKRTIWKCYTLVLLTSSIALNVQKWWFRRFMIVRRGIW